jgi:hypothetical protein
MNRTEAHNILSGPLNRFQNYADLVPRARSGTVERFEIRGENNHIYEIELQFFWDEAQKSSIRVFGSIYDASSGGFFPLTQTLLLTPTQPAQEPEARL